ncbi:hypothetical protein [Bauldia litoralis]|uniref:Uncharacterized protein n=1 Tax=Bauldia litoralis TaxID=665467 RepID=A0A1G6C8U7_9HYPH|nr:hypothetical protein [Bauldia litoralis]SDB29320.1 hypothetical protein SAMN02982931_02203 [Bauldia litoralis]
MTTDNPARAARAPEYEPVEHHGKEVDEPTTNARQGVDQQNVRYVLWISTGAVVVLFGILYLIFFA